MLVSHVKKFIYTKTVKTAGTSVEVYFEPYCVAPDATDPPHYREEQISEFGIVGYRGGDVRGRRWFNHMPAKAIKNQVGEQIWSDYFKFCVIRNPFDRYISAFYYLKSIDGIAFPHDAALMPDAEMFMWWMRQSGTIESIFDRDQYTIDGQVCVDFIIQYEKLLDGLEVVCSRLAIPYRPQTLKSLKGGVRPVGESVGDFFDVDLIDRIMNLYNLEIRLFGYCPPKIKGLSGVSSFEEGS